MELTHDESCGFCTLDRPVQDFHTLWWNSLCRCGLRRRSHSSGHPHVVFAKRNPSRVTTSTYGLEELSCAGFIEEQISRVIQGMAPELVEIRDRLS